LVASQPYERYAALPTPDLKSWTTNRNPSKQATAMSEGPDLTITRWVLASLPVLLLLLTIMKFRWSAPRAGGAAYLVAIGLSFFVFGGTSSTTVIASAKGLSLALFVLTILWTSVYMFNMAERLKGIDAIGRTMAKFANDGLSQALLIGWGFSSFIQGITGFGVPVAVAAPLLMMMGFSPARAAAIVLVGHGWAVTFGSMGSSYFSIQLVTNIPGEAIGPHMALLFAIPIIVSGFLVAHLQSGWSGVRKGSFLILITGSLMAISMWFMAYIGAPQIASSVPGIVAIGGVAIFTRTRLFGRKVSTLENGEHFTNSSQQHMADEGTPGFHLGFLPYYLLIFFSVISQLPSVKESVLNISWGLNYPKTVTGLGFVTDATQSYAAIRLFNHPAPLILFSLVITVILYKLAGKWRSGTVLTSLRLTYKQSLSTTIGVSTMVMMALIMADSGMTTMLAQGIAQASGPVFPLVSPFIGLMGSFMTGSNTNSNVMFGLLQVETARSLGIGPVTIASIQSIGASIGSSLAPTKVMVGAAIVGIAGRESEILRIITPYIFGLVLLVGIQAIVLVTLFPEWTR
jgi:lactate permease